MEASESFSSFEYCNLGAKPHLCTAAKKLNKSPSDETVHSASVLQKVSEPSFGLLIKQKRKSKYDRQKSKSDKFITQEMELWQAFREWEKQVKRKGAVPDIATIHSGGFEIKLPVSSVPSCSSSETSLRPSLSNFRWEFWQYEQIKSPGYGTPQWDPVCVKRRPDYRCCLTLKDDSDLEDTSHTSILSTSVEMEEIYELGYGPAYKKPYEWSPSESSLDRDHPLFGDIDREHRKSIANSIFPGRKTRSSRKSKTRRSKKSQNVLGRMGYANNNKSVQLWPQKEPTDIDKVDPNSVIPKGRHYSTWAGRGKSSRSLKDQQPSIETTQESDRTERLFGKSQVLREFSVKHIKRDVSLISASDLLIDLTNQSTLEDQTSVPADANQRTSTDSTKQQKIGAETQSLSRKDMEARRKEAVEVDKEMDALASRIMCGSECDSSVDTSVSDTTEPSYVETWEPDERPPTFWEMNRAHVGRHVGYSSSGSASSDLDSRLLAFSDEEEETECFKLPKSKLKEEMEKEIKESEDRKKERESNLSHLKKSKLVSECKRPSRLRSTLEPSPFRPVAVSAAKVPNTSLQTPGASACKERGSSAAGDMGKGPPVFGEDLVDEYKSTMLRLHMLAWGGVVQKRPTLACILSAKSMSHATATSGAGDTKMTAEEELFLLRDKAEQSLGSNRQVYIDIFQGETNIILRTVEGHLIVVDVEIAKQLDLYKYELECVGPHKFINTIHRLPPLPLESFILVLLWSSHFQADELPYESSSEESLISEGSDIWSEPSDIPEPKSEVSFASILSPTTSELMAKKKRSRKRKPKKKKKKKAKVSLEPNVEEKTEKEETAAWFRDSRKDPRAVLEDDPVMPDDPDLPLDGLVLLHAFLHGGQGVGGRMCNLLRAADALGARSLREAVLRMVARSAIEKTPGEIRSMLSPLLQETFLPHFLVERKGDIAKRLSSQTDRRYAPPYMQEYRQKHRVQTRSAHPRFRRNRNALVGGKPPDIKIDSSENSPDSYDSDKSTQSDRKRKQRKAILKTK